jgi:hypothetical protein
LFRHERPFCPERGAREGEYRLVFAGSPRARLGKSRKCDEGEPGKLHEISVRLGGATDPRKDLELEKDRLPNKPPGGFPAAYRARIIWPAQIASREILPALLSS